MRFAHQARKLTLATTLTVAAIPSLAQTVTFAQLTGTTGAPASLLTAVFKANLQDAGLGSFISFSISDTSGGFGGQTGEYTGFDLDAVKLSTTDCATAACAATAPALSLFDFVGGIVFSPGAQRAPADAKLFGTGPSGNTVNNGVATLGLFDGFISAVNPNGWVSLGDNGSIGFNLSSLVSTAGLYLYIGEVGNNGEVAGSTITLRQTPIPAIPEPEVYALMLAGLGLLGAAGRRRAKARAGS